jgi:hypothetical protein
MNSINQELEQCKDNYIKFFNNLYEMNNYYSNSNNNYINNYNNYNVIDDDIDDIIRKQNNMNLLYDKFHNNDCDNIYDSFIKFINNDYINSLNFYENNSKTFYEKLSDNYIKNVFDKLYPALDETKYILYSVQISWGEAVEYFLKLNYKYTVDSYNAAFLNNNLNIVKLLWSSKNEMLYSNKKIMDLACKNASLDIIKYLWSVDIYVSSPHIISVKREHKHRCNHISLSSYVNAISRKDNNTINVLNWLNDNTHLNTSYLFSKIKLNNCKPEIKEWLIKYIAPEDNSDIVY